MKKCGILHHTAFTRLAKAFLLLESETLMKDSGPRRRYTRIAAYNFVQQYRAHQKDNEDKQVTIIQLRDKFIKLTKAINSKFLRLNARLKAYDQHIAEACQTGFTVQGHTKTLKALSDSLSDLRFSTQQQLEDHATLITQQSQYFSQQEAQITQLEDRLDHQKAQIDNLEQANAELENKVQRIVDLIAR